MDIWEEAAAYSLRAQRERQMLQVVHKLCLGQPAAGCGNLQDCYHRVV